MEDCSLNVCAQWNSWEEWSGCLLTCAPLAVQPQRIRSRCWNDGTSTLCELCGRENCEQNEVKDCALDSCPLIYSPCTCTTDEATAVSAEKCDQYGNCIACDTSVCGMQEEHWSDWSDCSAECGGGVQNREICFIWADPGKEKNCERKEFMTCNSHACPIPCTWTEWDDWGGCTPKCKEGIKVKRRRGTGQCEARLFIHRGIRAVNFTRGFLEHKLFTF